MYALIILSALLFNASFLFPDLCGFLVLVAHILLFVWCYNLCHDEVTRVIFAGVLWGLLAFGVHFYWLYDVMINHSQAHILTTWMVYLFIVLYFSMTSGLWVSAMVAARRLLRKTFYSPVVCTIITACYWWLIGHWSLKPLCLGTGYPFLNPLIPLMNYPSMIKIITCASALLYGGECLTSISNTAIDDLFTYVAPVVNRVKNNQASWRTSPEAVGQKLYHNFVKASQHNKAQLYAGPESTFPFPLNDHESLVKLWSTTLSHDTHIFLGSVFRNKLQNFQAVFWLHKSLISKIYVKKMLMPFVETIPTSWHWAHDLKRAFLCPTDQLSTSVDKINHFEVAEYFDIEEYSLRIIPRICLEFFFAQRCDFESMLSTSHKPIILFFANDSWFSPFFREIMQRLVRYKMSVLGMPVMYVGHFGMSGITTGCI